MAVKTSWRSKLSLWVEGTAGEAGRIAMQDLTTVPSAWWVGLSSCLTGDLPDFRQLGPLSIPDGHAAVLGDSLGPACWTG